MPTIKCGYKLFRDASEYHALPMFCDNTGSLESAFSKSLPMSARTEKHAVKRRRIMMWTEAGLVVLESMIEARNDIDVRN